MLLDRRVGGLGVHVRERFLIVDEFLDAILVSGHGVLPRALCAIGGEAPGEILRLRARSLRRIRDVIRLGESRGRQRGKRGRDDRSGNHAK